MSSHTFRAKITKTVVDRLQPGDIVWDMELKGFGARKQQHSVSYVMKAFHNGRQRWLTIGKHGQPWNPATARQRALELKIDPDACKANDVVRATLDDLMGAFRSEHFPKLKQTTRDSYNIIIEKHILPTLGQMEVARLAHTDLVKLHNNKQKNPRTANLTLAVISKFMSWAEENNYRPQGSNPCHRIKKFPEIKRERFLTLAELGCLGEALVQLEGEGRVSIHAAAAIRLLIFTGARRNEILTLEWSHVDFERRKLFLPQSKTGKKVIVLSSQAAEILNTLPRISNNPFVIVGKNEGAHMVNISKPWALVSGLADLKGVRIHDLRHSYASVAASEGASLPVIGKLLGHTQPSTTARYAHLTDDAVAQVNDQVGSALGDALGKSVNNVPSVNAKSGQSKS